MLIQHVHGAKNEHGVGGAFVWFCFVKEGSCEHQAISYLKNVKMWCGYHGNVKSWCECAINFWNTNVMHFVWWTENSEMFCIYFY